MQHAAIIVKFLQDAKIFAIIFCVQHTEIIADIPACWLECLQLLRVACKNCTWNNGINVKLSLSSLFHTVVWLLNLERDLK